jgi:succinyl-diaminopimelate desuccinylase
MADNINSIIESMKNDIVSDTQELIRIKSIEGEKRPQMPFGDKVNDALITTLDIGSRLGFTTKNIDGYMGYIEWGTGDEIVGVLGHVDVVPEGDGWHYDPYGGEISEGRIYGRGTLDDKGPIVASIYAMNALKMSGFSPSKRIRILIGTNEESGCGEIEYYLEHEEAVSTGFTPDGYFPVIFAEKGIMIFNITREFSTGKKSSILYIRGGNRPNMVPDFCEAGIKVQDKESIMRKADAFSKSNNCEIKYEINEDTLILKSFGVSAHGSTPEIGKNAIMILLRFLDWVEICDEEVGDAIKFLSENIGMETKGETFNVSLHDDVSGDLSFNVGTIEMNANMMSLALNLRYPVTFKVEDVLTHFNKKLSGTGFEVKGLLNQNPLYFPKDHELVRTLLNVYESETKTKAEPLAIGGGTYAKEMKGIVAFGPIFPGKPDLDHQADEYIELEDMMKITSIYAHALKELSK